MSRMPLARNDRMKDAAPIAACSPRASSASGQYGRSWFIAPASSAESLRAKDIEKQPAWAAPSNSSGLVPGAESSMRER